MARDVNGGVKLVPEYRLVLLEYEFTSEDDALGDSLLSGKKTDAIGRTLLEWLIDISWGLLMEGVLAEDAWRECMGVRPDEIEV